MKRRISAAPPRSKSAGEAPSVDASLTSHRAWQWGGALVLALVVWLTYRGALDAPFIFDDLSTIVGNRSLRSLWPLIDFSVGYGPLQPPPQTAVSGRPIANLSLALNFHFGKVDPRGYRVTNIVLHVLVAVLLSAVVRRTLRLDFFQGKFADVADPLSLAAALLWALHPLDTECVEYVTQRTEVMMGLFYLLTLYASQRYWSSERRAYRVLWLTVAVASCQVGMLSKETMATVPAIVLMYERTFLAGSLRRALAASWPLYAGLALTWLPLAALNVHGPRTEAAGFGLGVSGIEWWFTQAKVLFLYLRLVAWPWPLVAHYELPYLSDFAHAWPWLVAATLLATSVTVLAWRRLAVGFVGAWFFVALSPTLVVPIPLEVAAERRMYVPLMALIPLVVVGCYTLLCRVVKSAPPMRGMHRGANPPLRLTLCATVAAACGYHLVDVHRLAAYTDLLWFWTDAESNQPDSALIQLSLGGALETAGRREEAIAHYERAVALKPDLFTSRFRLGEALQAAGRLHEAEQHYEEATRLNPEMAAGHFGLGQALRHRGDTHRAKEQYELALQIFPEFPQAHFALATLLDAEGDDAQAQRHYEQAIRAQPNYLAARRGLGLLLLRAGQAEAAIEQFRRMPPSADACANLAVAYAQANRPEQALAMAQAGASMARSQGQDSEAARLESWAKAYSNSLAQPKLRGNATPAIATPDAQAPPP